MYTGRSFVSHDENAALLEEVELLAKKNGLGICHNVTSWSNHDGYHRYLIFDPKRANGQVTIRSKAKIAYWETRYSRNYQPSISGEAACLRGMRRWLNEEAPELAHAAV